MKKFFAVLLSVVMIVSLLVTMTACGDKKNNDTSSAASNINSTVASSDDTTSINTSSVETPSTDASSVETPSTNNSSKQESTAPLTDAEKIVGTWKATVDMTDEMNELFAVDEEMSKYVKITKFEFSVNLQYKKGGTYKLTADEKSFKTAANGLKADVIAGMNAYLEDVIESNGLDMTVEEAAQEAFGMSIDEYVDIAFGDEMVDAMTDEAILEGKYKIKSGKLYMSMDLEEDIDEDAYITYKLTDTTLKLTEEKCEEGFGVFEEMLPLTFTKVK